MGIWSWCVICVSYQSTHLGSSAWSGTIKSSSPFSLSLFCSFYLSLHAGSGTSQANTCWISKTDNHELRDRIVTFSIAQKTAISMSSAHYPEWDGKELTSVSATGFWIFTSWALLWILVWTWWSSNSIVLGWLALRQKLIHACFLLELHPYWASSVSLALYGTEGRALQPVEGY